jgi:hypothetical protein
MGKTETSEADSLRMQNQADQEDASTSAFAKKNARISDAQRMSNQAAQEDASRAEFASKAASTALNPKTGMYGEPGSIEGFRASEAARLERIGTPYALNPDSPKAMRLARLRGTVGAKTGKMIKASKGGSVVARGNKLARSKPTKLF